MEWGSGVGGYWHFKGQKVTNVFGEEGHFHRHGLIDILEGQKRRWGKGEVTLFFFFGEERRGVEVGVKSWRRFADSVLELGFEKKKEKRRKYNNTMKKFILSKLKLSVFGVHFCKKKKENLTLKKNSKKQGVLRGKKERIKKKNKWNIFSKQEEKYRRQKRHQFFQFKLKTEN